MWFIDVAVSVDKPVGPPALVVTERDFPHRASIALAVSKYDSHHAHLMWLL